MTQNLNITVTLDHDEIQKYMEEFAQQIVKTEIAKHVRTTWEGWSNQYEFRNQIKKALSDRLQATIDEILMDYDGIKNRATEQIHRSIAARVTNTVKRLEAA